jgi:outer membrane protein assembly factor BamB
MLRSFPIASGVILLVVLVPCTSADDTKLADWPQWRGIHRDDISPDKGLLKEWPKDGPPLAWKATGIGQGFSSVAVVGDKVFTMGDIEKESFVLALNRDNGEKVWSAKVGKAGGNYPGTRCTPTVDGDRVYALGQFGDLLCLHVTDGSEVWRKNLPTDFAGKSGGWNYTESPLVDGDKLVCTPGGKNAVVALNKATGALIWQCDHDDTAGYSSIVVSNAGGVRQYVQLLANGVVGVDAKDGKLLWYYKQYVKNTANIPTPIILGDQVFCTAGYNKGGALLTLSAQDGKFTVEQNYFEQKLNNRHGGVVQVGDYIYGDLDKNGQPWCAAWKTGKLKDDWLKGAGGRKGGGSASITYADGHLYIHYENGYVALVDATPDGYKESGVFKLANYTKESWAHPVVIGGRLYQREQDTLWVYDVKAK